MDENEYSPEHITAYQLLVINQYQHLNQLFLKLPFTDVPKAGRNLSIFSEYCHRGLKEQKSPKEIVEAFFIDILKLSDRDEQLHMIFLILQFVERQILLFDALEDNAFPSTHRLDGSGSISQIISLLPTKKYRHKVLPIFEKYHAHLVLTAHPTQFYPPQVITILQDLTNAIASNDIDHIQEILLQLGKTSFRHNRQPTPEDEAIFLIDYLKNIFYPAISDIQIVLDKAVGKLPPAVTIGFWPGGDRDGNESVNVNTTLNVAELLHTAIITMYQEELSQLKRRLTFPTLWRQLDKINTRLTNTLNPKNQNTKNSPYKTPEELLSDCQNIRQQLIDNHDSLFLDAIDHWISAITCFGFNFAKIDIRQNSEIHHQTIYEIVMTNKCSDKFPEFKQYHLLDEKNKCDLITRCLSSEMDIQIETKDISDISKDTVLMLQAIPDIQKRNGKEGLHRYIISNTHAASHVLEVLLLAKWSGLDLNELHLDIIPLFESIQDLKNAEQIMRTLYENEFYRSYLQKRNLKQTIMLGFSDSTKDGGYVTANWSIYHCKLQLFLLGHDHNIDTLFFDGRGGPPARGGGNTHKFYRAIASTLPLSEIQLTIQGQTITTNFGTLETAKYHIEQLYTSGLMTSHFHLFKDSEYQLFKETLSYEDIERLDQLSNESFTVYKTLVNNPLFLKYLSELTPMNYYGDLNIASRPPRRDQQESPTLDNLRAITFVSAWSQMKQNIPGFYGLGTSLNNMIERGELKNLQRLYKENLFFHTLLDNAMQSLLKTQFSITQHLRTDPEFGSFWLNLKREADTTTTTLLQVSQQSELLADDFLNRASIQQREMIVLPLQIIQQYALMKARELRISGKETSKEVEIFHKIILKTIATNINASRNSA